jgi:AcrR family transcriptional regulator
VGYQHSRDDLLQGAIAVTLDEGFGALTFKRVGDRLGISDRTVVYYFPTKPDLITAVAIALGGSLEQLLAEAFGDEPLPAPELLSRAWPLLTTASADVVFARYFEIIGLATAGTEPYESLAPALVQGWIDWLVPRILGGSPARRRRQAASVVAQIDGLLLLRQIAGPDTARQAARELGITR